MSYATDRLAEVVTSAIKDFMNGTKFVEIEEYNGDKTIKVVSK